ncbi:DNA polymerase-3 subunit alpha [Chitinophaga skermanii]|uniref:DNA-directed DNA polymerase n=1 Tax=Chitinophaga skermanii TaxID=331697 RepID=A0A327R602_9BACT|nr:DNA polymerase III subunit alpha [Chitinophaga skermanii]RAJ11013.1 DNA polymerase-3 subunit alpha [Chitinophaga skermanii]
MFLNCKSWFSLRYGTIDTKELVRTAQQLGITSLALTNINNTTDAWLFVQECRAHHIKPILGVECRNGNDLQYILLAHNMEGWLHINQHISEHLQQETAFEQRAPRLPYTYAIYPWGTVPLADLQEHELVGVRSNELTKLFRIDTFTHAQQLVILQPVTYQDDVYFELHRLLRAVDQNLLITQLDPQSVAKQGETFVRPAQLVDTFAAYPHIIQNTLRVMEQCNITFDFHQHRNKKLFTASAAEDAQLLRQLAYEGMEDRYGAQHEEAKRRVEKELQVISDLHFTSYFLITWDIIRFANERHFFYVGRGSGANSIVAYCLKITNVDPIALDLYFERFLNPHRSSPPDFDLDFSWKDRDEITQYIFKKYGHKNTALIGTITTFQTNAIVRELGKVYGLPKAEIDKILNSPQQVTLNGNDTIQSKIWYYGSRLEKFPNHLSIHAGGILISEEPIHQYCTTHLPPKGFITTQFDMHIAEAIGLHKFDILSQRGLGHIREAMDIVKQNKGIDIDIHDVQKFMEDPNINAQLQHVNTIGCFYIESPAMRQLLLKLRCSDYITLVAASSIIRPGVAQSGMMRQYVLNFHAPEKAVYLHPIMEQLLKETYGIMVYQEDVIKVAHHYAELDLADADILRRAMAGKYRGNDQFQKIRDMFFDNCARLGRPAAATDEIWRQIASFAHYSFSKAHSASFAVESYQSLYLKTYFPAEFMVAVINNFGGFYNRELYFRELLKTGVALHAPCVNNSDYLTNIKGTDVYMGFVHVERLETSWVEDILRERKQNGVFAGLEDFIDRTKPAPEQLEILIRVGAFNFTGQMKKELLWKSSALQRNYKQHEHHMPLFKEPSKDWRLPTLAYHSHEDAFDEIDLLGFSLASPFSILQHNQVGYTPSRMFRFNVGRTIRALGYLVCLKHSRTSKGELMCFGTFLDAEMQFLDTVHFPNSLARYPFQKGGFYSMEGKVIEEFGVVTLNVEQMRKIGYFEDKAIA